MSEPISYDQAHEEVLEPMAHKLAKRYPPVEYDDIKQELSMYLWRNRNRMLPKGAAWINWELIRKGGEWCRKQRAQELALDDQYFYIPEDVERALGVFFDREDWSKFNGPQDDKNYGGDQPHDGLNGVVMLIDVQRVWDSLKLVSQQALYYVYGDGNSIESYCNEVEITLEAARKRVMRAKAELLELLNASSARQYSIGKRKVITNSAAQAITNISYQNSGGY